MSGRARGACPTVQAPMATGDGLLARLRLAERALSGMQLAGIARAASQYGNGILEVSARGNLQVRGLSTETVAPFASALAALDLADESGLVVETGPLAGLDVGEMADPRPLAAAIREASRHLWPRLGPKVAVTVDGGGALPLSDVAADIAFHAGEDGWRLRLSAGCFGPFRADRAVHLTLRLLGGIADRGERARARDLLPADLADLGAPVEFAAEAPQLPVGRFALRDGSDAIGVAPAFGRIEAGALERFASQLGTAELRLAPGRGILILGRSHEAVRAAASASDLVSDPADPRLAVSACAGAPFCASGHVETQALAKRIGAAGLGLRVHVAGCAKACAQPGEPHLALVGRAGGCDMHGHRITIDEATRAEIGRVMEDG